MIEQLTGLEQNSWMEVIWWRKKVMRILEIRREWKW